MPRRPPHYPLVGLADQPCRFGCAERVVIFRDSDTGLLVQLDPTPPPVTADLTDPDRKHRLWEFRGQHLGWVPVYQGQRSWRRCLLEHDCAHTPATHKPRRTHPIPPLPLPAPATPVTTRTRTRRGTDDRPVRRPRPD